LTEKVGEGIERTERPDTCSIGVFSDPTRDESLVHGTWAVGLRREGRGGMVRRLTQKSSRCAGDWKSKKGRKATERGKRKPWRLLIKGSGLKRGKEAQILDRTLVPGTSGEGFRISPIKVHSGKVRGVSRVRATSEA